MTDKPAGGDRQILHIVPDPQCDPECDCGGDREDPGLASEIVELVHEANPLEAEIRDLFDDLLEVARGGEIRSLFIVANVQNEHGEDLGMATHRWNDHRSAVELLGSIERARMAMLRIMDED